MREPELAIIGAGAAGIACALAAAARGARVLVMERTKTIGGTVVDALIHTLGGLFDDQGKLLNEGLPGELMDRLRHADSATKPRRIGRTWVLNIAPAVYRETLASWIAEYPNIETRYRCQVSEAELLEGRIMGLDLACDGERRTIRPRHLIDASGDAAGVRRIAPSRVTVGEALAGVIAHLRHAPPDSLAFPRGVALARRIRKAAEAGELPPACGDCWLDGGTRSDEIYVKFNIIADHYQPDDMAQVTHRLIDHLRRTPGWERLELDQLGGLGVRDGGRIQGDYRLTEDDLKQARRFGDRVARGCWPIEHWHPQRGIELEYLPSGQSYDIPLRALKVAGFVNLWGVGKCLSATPRAQASARVAGTCWAMGEGLAKALTEHASNEDDRHG
jgi:hypothetical protein